MDHWIEINELYRKITTAGIIRRIMFEGFPRRKKLLLLFVIVTIATVVFSISDDHSTWLRNAPILPLAISMALFVRAERDSFSNFLPLYSRRIAFYSYKFQYVRYLILKQQLDARAIIPSAVDDALRFMAIHKETAHYESATSNVFIGSIIGAAVAILAGTAGKWPADVVVTVLLLLAVLVAFGFMVHGSIASPVARQKELERFLRWYREDYVTASNKCLQPTANASAEAWR